MTSHLPTPPPPCPGSELPSLDEAAYLATARVLPLALLEQHLRTLTGRAETLLARLRSPLVRGEAAALSDAAHSLGGSAGTFGFTRLAAAASCFERAAGTWAPDMAGCAAQLVGATEEAVIILRGLVEAMVAPP